MGEQDMVSCAPNSRQLGTGGRRLHPSFYGLVEQAEDELNSNAESEDTEDYSNVVTKCACDSTSNSANGVGREYAGAKILHVGFFPF